MELSKLGGWHRLFIVISVLWTSLVILMSISEFPKEAYPFQIKEALPAEYAPSIEEIYETKPLEGEISDPNVAQVDNNTWLYLAPVDMKEKINGMVTFEESGEIVTFSGPRNITKNIAIAYGVANSKSSPLKENSKYERSQYMGEIFSDIENGGVYSQLVSSTKVEIIPNFNPIERNDIIESYRHTRNKILQTKQFDFVIDRFAFILIPLLILYAISRLINWVYKGFRKPSSTK